jgi:flagellar biosynthetic protein FliQ
MIRRPRDEWMHRGQVFSQRASHSWTGVVMDLDQATNVLQHSLFLALIISAPMLVIGLLVGVIVSLVQAVTQIQEQTLTFVPKITAMIVAAVLLMPWIGQHLLEYTARVFSTL